MNHESTLRPRAGTLEHLCRHWESQHRAAAAQAGKKSPLLRPFTIALSREAGTQGTSIAREVGHRLDWHVYDHELLEKIAQDMHLRTSLLESLDERGESWLTEMFEAFMSFGAGKSDWGPVVTESGYVHHLVKVVLALSVHGECVIVGRGAAFILPVETTLRVRLLGSVRDRIATLSQKLGISERDAARQIRTIDRERTDFVQDHFLKDATDARNYDLVLNASRFSVCQCATLIIEAVHQLKARRTEESECGSPNFRGHGASP